MTKIDVMFSKHSDEYETPIDLYRVLDGIFGFTLDPAASRLSFMHPNYYTIEDDGLSKDWAGEVCFINPPYSKLGAWSQKASLEFSVNGVEIAMLIPARTETRYWHDNIWNAAHYIVFLKGRLKFINKTLPSYATGGKPSSAPFPSAVALYMARDLAKDEHLTLVKLGHVINLFELGE